MNTATLYSHRTWAYLQMMRPANIVTAWADILAGLAVAGSFSAPTPEMAWLLLATTGLYGGGVVFNDVFDAELDSIERPERPIPSGRASLDEGIVLGTALVVFGCIAAFQASLFSGVLAVGIAFAALLYDGLGKHHPIFGPLNMGICRGGNLLLGVSAMPGMVTEYWFLALIPIVYIAAITALSRGEVNGGKTSTGAIAIILVITVMAGFLALGYLSNYQVLSALPLIVLFAARVLIPFVKATVEPSPENIRLAVRWGVLSLIISNAALSAGFASLPYGLLVLALLPMSIALAKIFAVT